jgi:hypothetical protein
MSPDEERVARRLLDLPEAGWPRQYGCSHAERQCLPGTLKIGKEYFRFERCRTCFESLRVLTREFGTSQAD